MSANLVLLSSNSIKLKVVAVPARNASVYLLDLIGFLQKFRLFYYSKGPSYERLTSCRLARPSHNNTNEACFCHAQIYHYLHKCVNIFEITL